MSVITRADLKRMRAMGFRRMGWMCGERPRHWRLATDEHVYVSLCLFHDSNPFDPAVSVDVDYRRTIVVRRYPNVSEALDDLHRLHIVATFTEHGDVFKPDAKVGQ